MLRNQVLFLLSFCLLISFAQATPPKVAELSIKNGSKNVDSDLKQIEITFDQPMQKGFAIVKVGGNFPGSGERGSWKDDKTFIFHVKLVPEKSYRFAINYKQYNTFRNLQGEPAKSLWVRFRTNKSNGTTAVQATPNVPKVISITPKNGATDVDPNLAEIVVKFDQPMSGGRSMTGGGKTFPEVTKIYWRDNKTFVAKVKLFADHQYYFGINSPSHRNFRGKNGVSVDPIRVSFKTRKAKPGEDANVMPATPPKVVSITPKDGSLGVDPNLKAITITFDQPMSGGRSITGGGESFPEIINKIQWKDSKTIVIPVKLKPNHEYRFGINSPSHKNFKSRYGNPVKWRRVTFKTRGFNEQEVDEHYIAIGSMRIVSAIEQKQAWRKLGELLTTKYAYQDRQNFDWQNICESMATKATAPRTAELLVAKMQWLLAHAQDPHLGIVLDGESSGTYISSTEGNANIQAVLKSMSRNQSHGKHIISAKTSDNIGYILVSTLSGNTGQLEKHFFEALNEVKDSHAIILDLRTNSGGDEQLARKIAGCFIKGQAAYAKHITVDPTSDTGFSPVRTRYFNQNDLGPSYTGNIAVLMGNRCMSSCEALLLMMKQAPNATLIGTPSRGSSGNPHRHQIIDGIQVSLPSWQAMTLEGVVFEGIGIQPDVLIETKLKDFKDADPVFEAAIKFLQQ
ncbi:Ig-like domain-containing protein [Poriferisphaera sp. WC338]|uniref:Ig-like domain-containing protein n=1 Tax=Poriferisphaera sp. WC338 TaxID=3425129 RepID=UPI003D81389D